MSEQVICWASVKSEDEDRYGECVGWVAEHKGALLMVSKWGAVCVARGLLVLSQTVSSEIADEDEREQAGKVIAESLVRRLR